MDNKANKQNLLNEVLFLYEQLLEKATFFNESIFDVSFWNPLERMENLTNEDYETLLQYVSIKTENAHNLIQGLVETSSKLNKALLIAQQENSKGEK